MKSEKEISKYLSYILRHKPDAIGVSMDKYGWVDIDELIEKTKEFPLNKVIIKQIVKNSDKQRFIIKDNKIRANQGHSIDVDLELKEQKPPQTLFHGTATKYMDSILKEGILPKSRQYVHLSSDKETAKRVGSRHGKPIVLEIDAKLMYQDGYSFFLANNGVWLIKKVPVKYIKTAS